MRTLAEWEETGHVENATLLDSLQNANTAEEIATTADLEGCDQCPIVVYCRSGSRAAAALEKLELAGFQGPLYNGLGVNQWIEAGFELVMTDSVDPECKASGPGEIAVRVGAACKAAITTPEESIGGSANIGISNDTNANVTTVTDSPEETQSPSGATSLPVWSLSLSMIAGILGVAHFY